LQEQYSWAPLLACFEGKRPIVKKCYLQVTHVNYPDQNETEQQAQSGSKFGKALQNLGKYGSCQIRNYLRETGLQKPSDQEGAALFFPQRKVLIAH
jgi:hypothetical protein